MRNLLSITDLSIAEIDSLLTTAADIEANPGKYAHSLEGKKLATLFFEPSTRTRLSFEAAMYDLGGHVIGFAGANSSSAAKGESVRDTVRTVSCYADIIAMRHPLEGAPWAAAQGCTVPIINAGDGGHHHPTQTLADLMTLKKEKGRLDHLTVGLCGDLKFGRTVHSLIGALSRYPGTEFVLISPRELGIPPVLRQEMAAMGIPYREVESIEGNLEGLDALYMTRVQRERFASQEEYLRLKDSCILTAEKMQEAPQGMIVMHPLPRVNEITPDVDDDPRACYFLQVKYGKLMRMALMLKLLGDRDKAPFAAPGEAVEGLRCANPRCITTEFGLQPRFQWVNQGKGLYRCAYCETDCP